MGSARTLHRLHVCVAEPANQQNNVVDGALLHAANDVANTSEPTVTTTGKAPGARQQGKATVATDERHAMRQQGSWSHARRVAPRRGSRPVRALVLHACMHDASS